MRSIRKRSFLLFELLVSLTLIVLCIFPLIKPHVFMRKADWRNLEEIQLERVAQEAFCLLKQELYENKETSWNALHKGFQGKLSEKLTSRLGKIYTCNYEIKKIESTTKQSTKSGLVVEVLLHFNPSDHQKTFQRTLYIERHSA